MITVSDECGRILETGSFTLSCRATVTLAGQVIADDLPVVGGHEEFDDNLAVPERVTVKFPRTIDGVDMIPTAATSPLAPYGQRLHIKLGVGISGGKTEWLDRGEFLIWEVSLNGNAEIEVVAVGLLELIDEARLVAPFQPTGTFTTALRQLLEPAVTVIVDPDVTALDRTVPTGINEDEDRLGALNNLMKAWPARCQMTPAGYLAVLPADDYPYDFGYVQLYNFTEDGITQNLADIIEVGGTITREGLANTVVARGQDAVGNQMIGVAYDKTPSGPTSLRGPFNPLPVPIYYFSPLLSTSQQCQDAAVSLLRRKAAQAAQKLELRCVPDPRFCGNDRIDYIAERSTDIDRSIPVVIERMTLPYTADSGPMVLIVREQA
jgi:hypothetical protein